MENLSLEGLTQAQKDWLDKCTQGSWSLNKSGLVDIDGHFDCEKQNLEDFKGVKFGVDGGDFRCSDNQLTSLEGAPQEVGGDFDCSYNLIRGTTLKLIHKTMVERNLPYIIALGLLKTRINKKEFDKLSSGYNEGSLNAASIMSRFV